MPTSLIADDSPCLALTPTPIRTELSSSRDPELFDQIAYCSIATQSVGALDLAQQLKALDCNEFGGAVGSKLTGVLMVEERLLIHWLEGPADALDAFWAQTENDPRQQCLVPLLRKRRVKKRLFDGWKMQRASRNEMMALVREAKLQISASSDPQAVDWQHAISTLNVMLDGELTACYAPVPEPIQARPHA